MSRIRTIKPEFWTSEQVISCSPLSRLLFIGLWNFCDDNGVHPASYVRVKAEVFPADNLTTDDIKRFISELISNGLLREYAVDDKSYWLVTGWKNHQRIDKPTYRHPLPLSELMTAIKSNTAIQELDEESPTTPGVLAEHSPTTPLLFDAASITEWKGMDGIGKDKDIRETKASPLAVNSSHDSAVVNEIFTHWQITANHPRAKLDPKRQRKITQALKLGYTTDELKQAIDGCLKTPFNVGDNDRHQKYDDIELILRDASHIDRFIANAATPPSSTSMAPQHPTQNIFTGAI